jgi:hypothetical protein
MFFHKPQPAPSILLIVLMEITIAAVAGQVLVRRRRSGAVRSIAKEWDMYYSPLDQFGLAEQGVKHLPVAGAAKVRAVDLIYRRADEDFFCVFSVAFTRGVLGAKHRQHMVAGVRQIRKEYSWMVAPSERKLVEQYEFVRQGLMGTKEPDKA